MQPARARANLERVERGAFVDLDRGIIQAAHGVGQPLPVFVEQPAGAQPVLVEAPERAEQAHHQLRGRHFHGEHRHRQAGFERDVLGDVERQRGLAHRRAPGNDHEVAGLQAGGLFVEVGIAGGHAGDVARVVAVVEHVHPVDHLREQGADGHETLLAARALLGDLEHFRLGLIEQLGSLAPERVVGRVGNGGAHLGQAPHDAALAHDLGVALDVGGRGGVLGQRRQIGETAGIGELGAAFQAFGNGEHIRRPVGVDQPRDVPVNEAVIGPVEVLLLDLVGDAFPGAVVEQQPAQHRLFGFERVRRQPDGVDRRIGMQGGDGLNHAGIVDDCDGKDEARFYDLRIARSVDGTKMHRGRNGGPCLLRHNRVAYSPTTVTVTVA